MGRTHHGCRTDDDARRFFDPKVIARIARLDLRAEKVVEGFIAGMHRSPFFGHSVEFAQHRDYVRGDDIRHLDWKVWSKTDRFYIKQFEAETNLRAQVVCDVSSRCTTAGEAPPGRDAEQVRVRLHRGRVPALLAVRQLDTVGMIAFDEDVRAMLPARARRSHLDAIVQTLNASRPKQKTDPLKIMRRVAESRPRPRHDHPVLRPAVRSRPAAQGPGDAPGPPARRMVFHIMDDDELDFPFAGTTRFEGMEELPDLLCDPKALRDGYMEALEEYLIEVRRGCSRMGVDYTLVKTSDYMDAVLSKFLHRRMAMRSGGRR